MLGEAHEPPLEGALHPEPCPSLVLHTRVLCLSLHSASPLVEEVTPRPAHHSIVGFR